MTLLGRLHARAQDSRRAWEEGAFCELGQGGADVDGCLAELLRRGYDGWIVVEQDQVLRPGRTFEDAVDSARRNRAWLQRAWPVSSPDLRSEIGRRRRLDALSGSRGIFAVSAIDHRDALTAAHARAGLDAADARAGRTLQGGRDPRRSRRTRPA